MSQEEGAPAGPDLAAGIAMTDLADGAMMAGHWNDDVVLLVRRGEEFHALEGTCTHYGGPLAKGIMVGDTVRCPWHHACFNLRSGGLVRPPALRDLRRYNTEVRNGMVRVTGPATEPGRSPARPGAAPESVVILGAGGAGATAAQTLRREGYQGPITVIDPDQDAPYDRPNCSKDYLAGNAPQEWMPLHPADFYRDRDIHLRLGRSAARIEPAHRRVVLDDGSELGYGALLVATGAEPIRLPLPVRDATVHTLRSLADSRAIIGAAEGARKAVVFGASFIGLEVAASLRARNLDVTVVAPDSLPLERVLGAELGRVVKRIHEEHGIRFALGRKPASVEGKTVRLDDGSVVEGDLIVAGVGVRPRVSLLEEAGIKTDRGVVVDRFLATSAPNVWVAGDLARWPDPHTGEAIRVEHWVVAERQGQTAARNILGRAEPFDAVPFFWSVHQERTINYVGHAEKWDRVEIDGDLDAGEGAVRYLAGGRTLAVATWAPIGRTDWDRRTLEAEVELEAARA